MEINRKVTWYDTFVSGSLSLVVALVEALKSHEK